METKNIRETKFDPSSPVDVEDSVMKFLQVAFPLTAQFKLGQWYSDLIKSGRQGKEDDQENGTVANEEILSSKRTQWLAAAQELEKVNRYIDQIAAQEKTEIAVKRGVVNALLDFMFSRHWFIFGAEEDADEILNFPNSKIPKLKVSGTAKVAKNKSEPVKWDFEKAVTAVSNLRQNVGAKWANELAESAENNGYKEFAKLIREELGSSVLESLGSRDARVAFNNMADPRTGYYRKYFTDEEGDFTELRREFVGEAGKGKVVGIYGSYLKESTDLKREDMIEAFNSETDFSASLSSYEKARKTIHAFYVEECSDINDRYKHLF